MENAPKYTSLPGYNVDTGVYSSNDDFDDLSFGRRTTAAPPAAKASKGLVSQIMPIGMLGYQAFTFAGTPPNPANIVPNFMAAPMYRKAVVGFMLARMMGLSPI